MFQIGKAVLYDMWGVCIIDAVEQQKAPEGTQEYLVLRPVYHSSAKLYLPHREDVLSKCLHPVVSKNEIERLLGSLKDLPLFWIENPKERGQLFRDALASGDRMKILESIRMLYIKKKELGQKGKNLRMTDEQALRDGEKLLSSEFAYVLQIPVDEVPKILHAVMEHSVGLSI